MPFSRVPVAFRSRPATRVLVYALVVIVAAMVGGLAASCARTVSMRPLAQDATTTAAASSTSPTAPESRLPAGTTR